jgi:hypothetical protein
MLAKVFAEHRVRARAATVLAVFRWRPGAHRDPLIVAREKTRDRPKDRMHARQTPAAAGHARASLSSWRCSATRFGLRAALPQGPSAAPLMGFALRSVSPARKRRMFPSGAPAHVPFPERPNPTGDLTVSQVYVGRAINRHKSRIRTHSASERTFTRRSIHGRSPRLLGLTCGQSARLCALARHDVQPRAVAAILPWVFRCSFRSAGRATRHAARVFTRTFACTPNNRRAAAVANPCRARYGRLSARELRGDRMCGVT